MKCIWHKLLKCSCSCWEINIKLFHNFSLILSNVSPLELIFKPFQNCSFKSKVFVINLYVNFNLRQHFQHLSCKLQFIIQNSIPKVYCAWRGGCNMGELASFIHGQTETWKSGVYCLGHKKRMKDPWMFNVDSQVL